MIEHLGELADKQTSRAIAMGFTRSVLTRMGGKSSEFVAKHWGEHFPFYYVTEYPRSGGNWLSRMIADYLQIPFPERPVFPLGFRCVVHNHWKHSGRLKRVYYLVRDGRDVCVSMYFFCIRGLNSSDRAIRQYYARRCRFAASTGDMIQRPADYLPQFIETWVKTPYGCRLSWPEHVGQWAFDRPGVVVVKYEDLLDDCEGTLARILPVHTGQAVVPARLSATVEKFRFENQTGRERGDANPSEFIRKGIAGDWMNHFTRDAGEAFDRYCGDMLVGLGYERDRSWFLDLPKESQPSSLIGVGRVAST